mgnify:FL=1
MQHFERNVAFFYAIKMKCAIIEYAKRKWETIKNGDYDEKTRCYIYDSSGSIVRDTVIRLCK